MSDDPQGVTDSPVTVVVVDDHRMFGVLLRRVISTDPGMACVGTADNLSDGFSMIDALRPDAVIMDVQVGGGRDRRDRRADAQAPAGSVSWC